MRKTALLSVVFVTASVLMAVSYSFSWAQTAENEVVVGNVSAMTGPTSGTHMMCQAGSKDYLNYLNEKDGGIAGSKGKVKVKYLAYDTQYVATKAKDGFAKLLEQGMIVCTHCASGHSDALRVDYETAKIPLVTGSHGIASPWSDWAYGNYHSGVANMIRSWIVWLKNDWEKAGKPGGTLVLGSIETDEPFVPLSVWELDSFLKEQGIRLVRATVPKGATDVSPQLMHLKGGGAKHIFVLSSAPGAVAVLKSAKSMNLGIPMTQCAAATLGDVIALEGSELTEGYQGEYFYEPISKNPKYEDSPGMKLVKQLWEKNHSGQTPNDMYVNGILSGMIIAEGIRLALGEVTPDKLTGETLKKSGLDRIKNFDCMGLTKPISYIPDDHIGPKQVRYWAVREGTLVPVSDWIPTTTFRIPKR